MNILDRVLRARTLEPLASARWLPSNRTDKWDRGSLVLYFFLRPSFHIFLHLRVWRTGSTLKLSDIFVRLSTSLKYFPSFRIEWTRMAKIWRKCHSIILSVRNPDWKYPIRIQFRIMAVIIIESSRGGFWVFGYHGNKWSKRMATSSFRFANWNRPRIRIFVQWIIITHDIFCSFSIIFRSPKSSSIFSQEEIII